MKSNYEPKLYKDVVKIQLSPLESLLKEGKFDEFLEKTQNVEPLELKKLKENNKDLPNILDNMLFNFSNYAFKKEKITPQVNADIEIPGIKPKKILREKAIEILNRLLILGANPNTPFDSFVTPFMKICSTNSLEMVKLLAENKIIHVNVEAIDSAGNKALSFATLADQPEIIEYLVKEQNCDINFKSILSLGQTVFHQACFHAKSNSASKLMELGVDPTIADINGLLPGNLIPEYDEEEDDLAAIDPKDMEKWENLYQEVLSYHKQYKEKNKTKKLIF